MDNGKIYTSTVRLYKSRLEHNQAYEYLMRRDKKRFKSKDDFIAEAIVHFGQHLRKEQDKGLAQEISIFLEDKDNPALDAIRNIIKEVLDENFTELNGKMVVSGSGTAEPSNLATECSDMDKRFAEFYDYD